MNRQNKIKINLVKGERVAIINSHTHTYDVRYVKSGKFGNVLKSLVKTIYIDPNKKKNKKGSGGQINIEF